MKELTNIKRTLIAFCISAALIGCSNNGNDNTTVDVVPDTEAPLISLSGASVVTVAHGGTYSDAGATATDLVDGSLAPVMSGAVDTSRVGSYNLNYDVADSAGNEAVTVTRTVNVIDQAAPVIALQGNASEFILINTNYAEAGATATDAAEGEVNVDIGGSVDVTAPGVYTLNYSAQDSAGNQADEASRTVTVIDAIAFPVPTTYYDYGNFVFDRGVSVSSFTENGFSGSNGTIENGVLNLSAEEFTFHRLVEGMWLEQVRSNLAVEFSQLNSVALVGGFDQYTIESAEEVSEALIRTSLRDGTLQNISLPAGSVRATVKSKLLEDQYIIFDLAEGITDLDEVMNILCGNPSFQGFDSTTTLICDDASPNSGTVDGTRDGVTTEGVGTWARGNLPNSTIEAVIVTINPEWNGRDALAPTESEMFAIKDGQVWIGQKTGAGAESTHTLYNQTAHDVIVDNVVWIDPNNSVITITDNF